MSVWPRRAGILLVPGLIVLASGCTRSPTSPAPTHRDATEVEQSRLVGVVLPLLESVKISVPPKCVVRLGILLQPHINAAVEIRQEPRCPQTVALLITEGALSTLSSSELRGLLAHQLGHLGLRHGTPPAYTIDQERQADRLAVTALLQIGGREYCRGLASAFTRIVEAGAAGTAWRAVHPMLREQASAIRQACESSPRESASAASR